MSVAAQDQSNKQAEALEHNIRVQVLDRNTRVEVVGEAAVQTHICKGCYTVSKEPAVIQRAGGVGRVRLVGVHLYGSSAL